MHCFTKCIKLWNLYHSRFEYQEKASKIKLFHCVWIFIKGMNLDISKFSNLIFVFFVTRLDNPRESKRQKFQKPFVKKIDELIRKKYFCENFKFYFPFQVVPLNEKKSIKYNLVWKSSDFAAWRLWSWQNAIWHRQVHPDLELRKVFANLLNYHQPLEWGCARKIDVLNCRES